VFEGQEAPGKGILVSLFIWKNVTYVVRVIDSEIFWLLRLDISEFLNLVEIMKEGDILKLYWLQDDAATAKPPASELRIIQLEKPKKLVFISDSKDTNERK
jgi:hypothetical protein